MKELTFDFRTVGGVTHIYAIPPETVSAIEADYATECRTLTLASDDEVIAIPCLADETFSFGEQHGRNEHGDYWQPTVVCVVPKASLDNASVIEQLERGEWLVVTLDHNGVTRLCGDLDTQLTCATDATTGMAHTDRNATTLTFTGRLGHPSWYLDQDL